MLHEKLVGFDIGLWDRSILKQESKNLFVSGTYHASSLYFIIT